MPTPHPPRPPWPPAGGDPGESDDALAALLRERPESVAAASAAALLTARHWRPAHDYAAICLATSADVGPAASTGVTGHAPSASSPAAPAPTGAAGPPTAPVGTRLRNEAAGLCLDVPGGPGAGAGARLTACSARWTQRWTYEDGGLLRSVADPGLCLDSRADAGVVVLGTCADEGTARGHDVRYALTTDDELVLRRDPQLALAATAPEPGADIVVTLRDSSTGQRWRADPAPTSAALSEAVPAAGRGSPAACSVGLADR